MPNLAKELLTWFKVQPRPVSCQNVVIKRLLLAVSLQELYPRQSSPNHCTALNSAPYFLWACGVSGNIADQLICKYVVWGPFISNICGLDRLEIGGTNYVVKGGLLTSSPLFFHEQAHTLVHALRGVGLAYYVVNVCDWNPSRNLSTSMPSVVRGHQVMNTMCVWLKPLSGLSAMMLSTCLLSTDWLMTAYSLLTSHFDACYQINMITAYIRLTVSGWPLA